MSVNLKKMDNHVVQQVAPPRQLSDIERQESSVSNYSNMSTISDLEQKQEELEKQQDEIEKTQEEMSRQQKEIERQQKEMERQKQEMEREHREAMEKLNSEMAEMKQQMALLKTSTAEVKEMEEDLKEEFQKTQDKMEEKEKEESQEEQGTTEAEHHKKDLQTIGRQSRIKEDLHAIGHVTMKRICTFDPRLHIAGNLVVVPTTGDIVIYGKSTEKDPLAFHIYHYDAPSERLTHRLMKDICECDYYIRMLPVTVEGVDLLAVACPGCKDIRLLNLLSGRVLVAFQDDRFQPYRMCSGEDDRIFAHCYNGRHPIIELNTDDDDFTLAQTLEESGMWDCWGMCYAPGPNAVVLSNQHDDSIHAISYERDNKMWELKGVIDSEKCDPRGLLYYPEHRVVLVSDGCNERVLVVNPENGNHMSTIPLGRNMGTIINMGLYKQQVAMMHYAHKKFKLSFFEIH